MISRDQTTHKSENRNSNSLGKSVGDEEKWLSIIFKKMIERVRVNYVVSKCIRHSLFVSEHVQLN